VTVRWTTGPRRIAGKRRFLLVGLLGAALGAALSLGGADSQPARERGGGPDHTNHEVTRDLPFQIESEGTMARVLGGLVLGVTLMGGWCATAADDLPKELTPEQRKELEARWEELTNAFIQFSGAGKLPEAAAAAKKALETARRLCPRQDHSHLAVSLNNMAVVLSDQGKYADAETFSREALAIRRRLCPKQDHPGLAMSLNNLAAVLQVQRKYADADGDRGGALRWQRSVAFFKA
jgi:tetratricopeptide (TPR) repeat protein